MCICSVFSFFVAAYVFCSLLGKKNLIGPWKSANFHWTQLRSVTGKQRHPGLVLHTFSRVSNHPGQVSK
jgi:hypothetical protein